MQIWLMCWNEVPNEHGLAVEIASGTVNVMLYLLKVEWKGTRGGAEGLLSAITEKTQTYTVKNSKLDLGNKRENL